MDLVYADVSVTTKKKKKMFLTSKTHVVDKHLTEYAELDLSSLAEKPEISPPIHLQEDQIRGK